MCCSGKPVPLASFNWKIKQASKYNFIIEIKRQITIFRSQGNPKIVYIYECVIKLMQGPYWKNIGRVLFLSPKLINAKKKIIETNILQF